MGAKRLPGAALGGGCLDASSPAAWAPGPPLPLASPLGEGCLGASSPAAWAPGPPLPLASSQAGGR
eukprot:2390816-Pyramimonas_sp.AAC.1